jgi:diguanylate cyclase (GGDEF)-like protein
MSGANTAFLARVGVFSLLGPEEIAQVAEHLATVELAEGQTLFHEGDQGNDLYILASGEACVSIRLPDGGEREIARFAPGDFFGEMSIFDNAPRSATCAARASCVLYSLSKDAFSDLLAGHPKIALKLMYRMLNITTQRLRGTSEFVSEMVLWGEGARKRAVTDELTGVYNRRFLEDSLGNYVAEAGEKGQPLSLAMVDLDRFRQINEMYGAAKGDEAIRGAAGIFRSLLREHDVIARYGGDEFVIVLPATMPETATEIMAKVCVEVSKLPVLKGMKGEITTVTSSIGVAGYPFHASDLSGLRAAADAALYKAKEGGRNRAVCALPKADSAPPKADSALPKADSASKPNGTEISRPGAKRALRTIKEKNDVISRIIDAIVERRGFLILGHLSADDDCISAMISFALVLHMFYKEVTVHLDSKMHDRFKYLLDICRYNSIPLLGREADVPAGTDTVVLCDTPKPSMIDASPKVLAFLADRTPLRIEIDHHLGADSGYFGDPGYRLVTEASSASELIGHILLKLEGRTDLLEQHQVGELFPRNLVLAILTGIIGDSNMGLYLKSRREKKYYEIFSNMFSELLSRRTTKKTNFFTMDEVFSELQKLSSHEENCLSYMMGRRRVAGSLAVVTLSAEEMAPLYATCDMDTIITTARVVADRLAEESGKLGLIAYYDNPTRSDLVQFRLRRAGGWKSYDLRKLLERFSIANGGGHEGAIGFRIPRAQIADFPAYVSSLEAGIEEAIKG